METYWMTTYLFSRSLRDICDCSTFMNEPQSWCSPDCEFLLTCDVRWPVKSVSLWTAEVCLVPTWTQILSTTGRDRKRQREQRGSCSSAVPEWLNLLPVCVCVSVQCDIKPKTSNWGQTDDHFTNITLIRFWLITSFSQHWSILRGGRSTQTGFV